MDMADRKEEGTAEREANSQVITDRVVPKAADGGADGCLIMVICACCCCI
jgi:hypothetical protein